MEAWVKRHEGAIRQHPLRTACLVATPIQLVILVALAFVGSPVVALLYLPLAVVAIVASAFGFRRTLRNLN